MDWKKGIGLGVLLWVIIFALISVFIGFNIYDNTWMKIVTEIIVAVVAFVLAGVIKPKDARAALMYGIAWVIIGVILDAVVTMRFNALIFQSKSVWLGYLLILIAPLVYTQIKKSPKAPKKPEAPEAPAPTPPPAE